MLVVLFALVVADGVVTRFLLDYGLATEGNPLLQDLVTGNRFLPTKIVAAFLCVILLSHIYWRRPRAAMRLTMTFVALYTGIVYWNISLVFFGLSQMQP
ncbi:MAG: hypothetical protein HYX87_07825 [Chloroflexi bacterium]|nr:hypothetical protein [Chloroflexota bacterium]